MANNLEEKLTNLITLSTALKLRMDAASQEFTAAVLMNDAKDQDRIRNNLHAFLDAHLDALSEMGTLTRAVQK